MVNKRTYINTLTSHLFTLLYKETSAISSPHVTITVQCRLPCDYGIPRGRSISKLPWM